MLKKILFTVAGLLISVSGIMAQETKEDKKNGIKSSIKKIGSIQEARDVLNKQMKAARLYDSMGSIQGLKIIVGDEKTEDDDDEQQTSVAVTIPQQINSDNIRKLLINGLSKTTFRQALVPPKSNINIFFDDDIQDIENSIAADATLSTDIIIHKIFYANGTTEDADIKISESDDGMFKNAQSIDSMQVDIVAHYPTHIQKTSLSADKPTITEGNYTIQLTSINGHEANLLLSENVHNNLVAIQGRDKKGTALDHTSKTWSNLSTEMNTYVLQIGTICKNLIQNIDDNKYASLDELKKDMTDKLDINSPEKSMSSTTWVRFPKTINQIDVYYISARDSVKVPATITNGDLTSTKEEYHRAGNDETDKYGVVDNLGNWIIEPQFDRLMHVNGLFFAGMKTEDDGLPLTYKLDIEKNELVPYKYRIRNLLQNKYFLISENDTTSQIGVMDLNEKIIIAPVKKYSIDAPTENFIEITDYRGDTFLSGLYDSSGKVVLPEVYQNIEIKDGYIYATKDTNRGSITFIFDTNIRQITKSNWDAKNQFSDHSDLVLIEDERHKCFYINKQGQVTIAPSDKYTFSDEFWSGVTVISLIDSDDEIQYGYMNDEGEIIIEPQFDEAQPFQGKYAYVEKNRQGMLIDKDNVVYKTFPSLISSWQNELNSNPAKTRYTLKNGSVYDGYGNLVKDKK